MAGVIDRYEIKPDVRKALLEDDSSVIAPLVNAYLLRFYFQIRGMPEAEFIARLHALKPEKGNGRRMGNLVGVFAASHGPIIARDWDMMPDAHRRKLTSRLRRDRPTAAGVPARCPRRRLARSLGQFLHQQSARASASASARSTTARPSRSCGRCYRASRLKGHAAFGRHLLDTALTNDFEPALSHRLKLDHGTCIPLWRIGVDPAAASCP